MSIDILSDVLRGVRLRGAVYFDLAFGREWSAEAPPARAIADALQLEVEHAMEYHVLTRGHAWAAIDGEPPVRLAAGDVVMFPHGDRHVISSAPGLPPLPFDLDAVRDQRDAPMPIGFDLTAGTPQISSALPESDNRVVCGFILCDLKPFNPLIAHLPRLLHLPAGEDSGWIAGTLRQAVRASQGNQPGHQVVLERISEMMFVHAVRRYLETMPAPAAGWLAGLRDRHVGRALALLHARPADPWTVDSLGRTVGLSRSALHERFMELMGTTPMQYLTQWRMQLASRLLRDGRLSVASVALEVGYDSEAAFARAFKRVTGLPPATWRRQQR